MNRKHSHDPVTSYPHSNNHKPLHQTTSPYIQLLQSKKKVYGYRYDTKNVRSFTNYIKPSPSYVSSVFGPGSKNQTSASNEKKKISNSTIEKRKRNKTEQEQLQKSVIEIHHQAPEEVRESRISKSLYYDHLNNSHEFAGHLGYLQQGATHNKKKRHLSQNKHHHSESHNQSNGVQLEKLQITDIDGLINLIDSCVGEANDYIAYLSDKLNSMKDQLSIAKVELTELNRKVDNQNLELTHKRQIIANLEKELERRPKLEKGTIKKENVFEVKSLLQTIERISQQNQKLREEISELRSPQTVYEQNEDPRGEPELFNSIHSKIDIFNISIDNNQNFKKGNSPSESRNKKSTAKTYKQALNNVGR